VVREILPARTADFPTPAQRPLFSALDCQRFVKVFGLRLPGWEDALRMAMDVG
jgi:dTDP-4-dehydrorhamnose reductase